MNSRFFISTIYTLLALSLINTADIAYANANIPSDFKFTKNMRYKDTISPDIAYLQNLLNQDPKTRVAESGNGSLMNPTTYFGTKTLDAVKRFQELYRSEILEPVGLNTATGYIGQYTLNKLNAVLKNIQSSTSTTQVAITPSNTSKTSTSTSVSTSTGSTTQATSYTRSNSNLTQSNSSYANGAGQIASLSSYKSNTGDNITIIGTGFHPTLNEVYLGPILVGKYSSDKSGSEIKFSIPGNISSGKYQVSVSNIYGDILSKALYIDITNTKLVGAYSILSTTASTTQSKKPELYSLTPYSSDSSNSVIRIFGKNFPANGNIVLTNFGNISNLPSSNDGMTIDITAGSIPGYRNAFKLYKGGTFPLLMTVTGPNGTSTNVLWHLLTFPDTSSPKVADNSQLASDMTQIDQATKDFKSNLAILNPTLNPYDDLVNHLEPSMKERVNPLVSNKNFISRFSISTSTGFIVSSSSIGTR